MNTTVASSSRDSSHSSDGDVADLYYQANVERLKDPKFRESFRSALRTAAERDEYTFRMEKTMMWTKTKQEHIVESIVDQDPVVLEGNNMLKWPVRNSGLLGERFEMDFESATDAEKRGEEIRNAFSFEWIGTFDDPNKIESGSLCATFSNPVSDHQEDEFEKVEEVAIERDEFEADEVDPEDAREFCVIKGSA